MDKKNPNGMIFDLHNTLTKQWSGSSPPVRMFQALNTIVDLTSPQKTNKQQ